MFYLIIMFLLCFQGTIENFTGFNSIDEIILIFLAIVSIKKIIIDKATIKIFRIEKNALLFFFIYLLMGILSDLIYNIQGDHSFSVISGILSIKSILIYYFARICTYNTRINNLKLRRVYEIFKLILWGYAIIGVLNSIFNFIPAVDIRYGIKSVPIGFSHVSELDFFAFMIFLFMMFLQGLIVKKRNFILNFIPLFIITLCSGRTKALACFVIVIISYILIIFTKKIKIKYFIYLSPLMIYIGYDRIIRSFFNSNEARGVITRIGIKIANDFFPFGSGFGTFGTYFSIVRYSPLYYRYNINTVWGLAPGAASFAMDTQWPPIIAESGYIGAIAYLIGIILIIRFLFKLKTNTTTKLAMISIMVYGLIASTSDSIFTSYRGSALFVVIAVAVSIYNNKSKDFLDSNLKGEKQEG